MNAKKTMATVGQRLRKKRASAGMTLRELGDKAGVSFVTIGRAETGSVDIKVSTLLALSKAFGVSPLFFLN